jgi:hypothetical protein
VELSLNDESVVMYVDAVHPTITSSSYLNSAHHHSASQLRCFVPVMAVRRGLKRGAVGLSLLSPISRTLSCARQLEIRHV